MIEIERFDYSAFRKQYTLDNELFYIYLIFNSREEAWYMEIQDSSENVVLSCIKLVTEIFLLNKKRTHANIPKGDFKLVKQSDNNSLILNYDTLGTEYILYYYEEDEL